MEDRFFKYALMISLLLHVVVLFRLSYSNIHFLSQPIKSLEVVYPKMIVEKGVISEEKKSLKGMKVELENQPVSIKERLDPLVKDISKFSEDFLRKGQKPKQIGEKGTKRKVLVPALEAQQIKNPLYLDYYKEVRSRIRERAYSNYQQLDSGEVYLSFIVEASGELKRIKIIEERTKANQYLRRVSMQSVKEASPFPSFPENLKYPELSFNVVISFEVE